MPTRRTWTFATDGAKHTVEMEHGGVWSLSGNRVITVDGQVVERAGKFWDTGSEHRFEVEGHPCILRIRHQVFGYEYELWVDGKPMPDPANPVNEEQTPASQWRELIAMALLLLGGAAYFFLATKAGFWTLGNQEKIALPGRRKGESLSTASWNMLTKP